MAPPPSHDNSQSAEILLLLRKISQDNEQLRSEMASLREENRKIKGSLHKSLEHTAELKDQIKLSQATLENKMSSQHNSLQNSLLSGMTTLSGTNALIIEAIKTCTRDKFEDLGAAIRRLCDFIVNVDSNMETVIRDEVAGLNSIMMYMRRELSEKSTVVRSDIACVRHALGASSSNHVEGAFILFPRLAPELRVLIWKMVCFDNPAVVKVDASYDEDCDRFRCLGYRTPAVLHTNREARREALKYYKKSFVDLTKLDNGRSNSTLAVNPKYFNFHVDILYLVNVENRNDPLYRSWIRQIHEHESFRKFRRIAVSEDEFNVPWMDDVGLLFDPPSQIDEIIIVANGDDLSNTRQQLVRMPEESVLRKQSESNDEFVVSQYLGSRRFPSFFVEFGAELDSALKSAAKANRVSDASSPEDTAVSENTAGAPNAASSSSMAQNGDFSSNSEAKVERNMEPERVLPKITFMILRDLHPVRNTGLVLG